jgi:hypothetical protein
MANLFVNLPWCGDGLRNLLSQKLPMSLAHPLHGGFHRRFGHPESFADFRVR